MLVSGVTRGDTLAVQDQASVLRGDRIAPDPVWPLNDALRSDAPLDDIASSALAMLRSHLSDDAVVVCLNHAAIATTPAYARIDKAVGLILIDTARPRLDAFIAEPTGLTPWRLAIEAQFVEMPLASGSVDALACLVPIDLLVTWAPEALLRQAHRVLTSSGSLSVLTSVPTHTASTGLWRSTRRDRAHARTLRLLNDYGFQVRGERQVGAHSTFMARRVL